MIRLYLGLLGRVYEGGDGVIGSIYLLYFVYITDRDNNVYMR